WSPLWLVLLATLGFVRRLGGLQLRLRFVDRLLMLLVDLGLAPCGFGIAPCLLARDPVLLELVFSGLLTLEFGNLRRLNRPLALLAPHAVERLLFGRRQWTGHGRLRRGHGRRGFGRRVHLLGRRRRQRGQRPGGTSRRGRRRGLLLRHRRR